MRLEGRLAAKLGRPFVDAHCQRNYGLQADLYTLAALRLFGIADAATYERRFGGVLYCFLRGMRPGDDRAGLVFRRPRWDEVLASERAMLGRDFWGIA